MYGHVTTILSLKRERKELAIYRKFLFSDSGSGAVTSNVLEVCELPPLVLRSDYERVLHDLIAAEADIQISVGDQILHLHDINNSNNQTISAANKRVFAVFLDSSRAAQTLRTVSSTNYNLKHVNSISDPSV
jgi:hypothetical protein